MPFANLSAKTGMQPQPFKINHLGRSITFMRYKDWMKAARDWATEQAKQIDGVTWDRNDFSIIRPYHPPWIPEPYWHQMIEQAQAWGHDPTSSEVYERLHCVNRTGPPGSGPPTNPLVYVYPKAGIVHRRFRELKDDAEASQTPDSPPIDEKTLWEQSGGGRKKGRIFCWTTQDPRYAMTGECSSSSGGRSSGTASADERQCHGHCRVSQSRSPPELRYILGDIDTAIVTMSQSHVIVASSNPPTVHIQRL
ncbi:hypothetical protein L6452_24765 [Arctium lappa]|uniref:Uncharacterized protein n=1 Tax=Arctium lappa TaxID=4217 RepID=A0ACB9AAZ4_ARCLA|nr:hypothetical protein L6452_24765 [Arctium lappa]